MFVTRIAITKDGYSSYGYSKVKPDAPYNATIEVQGQNGKIELTLTPEMTNGIMAIIAEEVAAAGKRTAEMMTAEIIQGAALPAPVA